VQYGAGVLRVRTDLHTGLAVAELPKINVGWLCAESVADGFHQLRMRRAGEDTGLPHLVWVIVGNGWVRETGRGG